MFARLFSLEHQRRRLAHRAPSGPLRAFLATPFPDPGSDARAVDYVALDLETTGLDPERDAIVSIGMVGLHGTRIDLATARHQVICVDRPLPAGSVVIHQLTDDAVSRGEPLARVLAELLSFLAGKVLIAHHAQVEFRFLRRACAAVFHGEFLVPVVDTQWLARRWLERRDRHYTGKDLRLFNLRERYNLPRYQAHNALSDALAAGELFAAQIAEYGDGRLPLKRILTRP